MNLLGNLFGGGSKPTSSTSNFHQLSALDIDKKNVDFKSLNNRVVLVEFASLLGKYPATDLTIVAFPCNQFGGQEPGTNAEIKAFAAARGFSGAGALLMDKVDVNGANTSPVYNFLKVASGDTSDIGWNFGKFLVRPDGTVYGRYAPTTGPMALEKYIVELINSR
ncbi:hypothetical protein HXX76_007471 [Chlamydomonas incerta]|uniref:Glutathione peroxidase n=1 Tax=Chlamydomonas incerta TaxID=51695 RepID=A0A835SY93_CHLIN|nr:hypothetical protein HXX76_007471 [Chlamydomonas incerta]|eukprot:KAG2435399.1 hypothetical protein HXX76_007471 [Chlamydomonas incerta]